MTPEEVRELFNSKFKGYKILVVSNREPYIHMYTPEGIKCKTPAGGLTAALDPLMQACSGIWVAGGSGDADRDTVDENNRIKVPPEKRKYTLKRVWMTKEEVDNYYFGFSNQTLWPLCHNVFQKPDYREDFWTGYKKANELFTEGVLSEVGEEKLLIWAQDYHLALLPKFIREKLKVKDSILAHFWHIPWPHWETFSFCPWGRDILEGMLGNDLISFHLKRYCVNFLASVEKLLKAKVDYKELTVKYNGRKIFVSANPLGIDFDAINNSSKAHWVEKEVELVRSPNFIPYKYIGVGVDRIDYTKGIVERFKAIERFLEKYPQYQNNFVFIEAGAQSRTRIHVYMDLHDELRELAEEINWKYQRGRWKPIMYIEGKLDLARLLALYRTADVCVISPLHDGMNLVAKEFVAANTDCKGVLIISKFAGCSEELKDAIVINPNNLEEFADAMAQALCMSEEEKKLRMEKLRETVKENNVYKWLADFLIKCSNILGTRS